MYRRYVKEKSWEVAVNIKRERIKLLLGNSGLLLVTQTIMVVLLKLLISSGRLDNQIYFFGYLPVVINAIAVYMRSRYSVIRISKTDDVMDYMIDFMNSEYLTRLDNQDEYTLKTKYSVSRVKLQIYENETYYELNCPRFLKKAIKNYGIHDFFFTQHDS